MELSLNPCLLFVCLVSPPSVRSSTTSTTTSTTTAKPVTQSTTSRVLRIWTLQPPVNISSNRAPTLDTSATSRRNHKNTWYQTSMSNVSNVFSTSRPSVMGSYPLSSKSPTIQSSTAQTPYWWRPHFTKLPSIKSIYDPSRPADEGYASKKKGIVSHNTNPLKCLCVFQFRLLLVSE